MYKSPEIFFFFDTIFPYRSMSENIAPKCDVIFQIIFYLVMARERHLFKSVCLNAFMTHAGQKAFYKQ